MFKIIYTLIALATHTTLVTHTALISTNDSTENVLIYKKTNIDFSFIIRPNSVRSKKIEDGTFNNSKHDRGNYVNGRFVGTNRSVSAPTLQRWRGYPINADHMKNLTKNEAIQIYKKIYVDHNLHKMEVYNPILVDIIFNAICSSSGVARFKTVCKKMGISVSDGANMKIADVESFNSWNNSYEKEMKFYKLFWELSKSFYEKRSKGKLSGLKKWIQNYDYFIYEIKNF